MTSRTTALFSFEGTNLALVRRFGVRLPASSFSKGHHPFVLVRRFQGNRHRAQRPARNERTKFTTVNESASDEVGDGEFLENCIEKNFHVSQNAHESGHQTFRV